MIRYFSLFLSLVCLRRVLGLTVNSPSFIKRSLASEYASFFTPLQSDIYCPDLVFTDPLSVVKGVSSYEKNIDLIAGRGLIGGLVFGEGRGRIYLHKIEDNLEDVDPGSEIYNIRTYWTLKIGVKLLPWDPQVAITGVSLYEIERSRGLIVKQDDFWDTVNLESGKYKRLSREEEKMLAIKDMFSQSLFDVKSRSAAFAAPPGDLPFELLRVGRGYDCHRYPKFSGVCVSYERRDEAFADLGDICRKLGVNPMMPSLIRIPTEKGAKKKMIWPVKYEVVGGEEDSLQQQQGGEKEIEKIENFESTAYAVKFLGDAITKDNVENAYRELCSLLSLDGLTIVEAEKSVRICAQYDAVFSMGTRKAAIFVQIEDIWGIDRSASPK